MEQKIRNLLDDNLKLIKYFDKLIQEYDNTQIVKSIKSLKQNLGKLQSLSLINKIKGSDNYIDILNGIIKILQDNISNINIITNPQIGGSNNYYNRYIKYKCKYKLLKNNINFVLS